MNTGEKMKNVIETLQEKYNNVARNDKAKLAKFLKRRRMELGYTLEEVSDGICSTSYLSKIENCQVEVDDNYYHMLFEKLHLEYQSIVEHRMVPIYTEIIKAYLKDDRAFIESKLNGIVGNNAYCDTEIEMLVVIYNLIGGSMEEASTSIRKLELVKNTLSLDELLFLSFLNVVYDYKTYRFDAVKENIEVLLRSSTTDEVMHLAIIDLALNYYYEAGFKAQFYHLYAEYLNHPLKKIFSRIELIHSLQELVLLGEERDDLDDQFYLLNSITPPELLSIYHYYYGCYLINKKAYEQAFLLMQNEPNTVQNLTVMGISVNRINDFNVSIEYLQILKNQDLTINGPYEEFLDYMRLKLEQYGYSYLHNYLKHQILPHQKRYQCAFLLKEEEHEYQKVAFELGRYKEVVKAFLKI